MRKSSPPDKPSISGRPPLGRVPWAPWSQGLFGGKEDTGPWTLLPGAPGWWGGHLSPRLCPPRPHLDESGDSGVPEAPPGWSSGWG